MVFDPTLECTTLPQQKRKKAAKVLKTVSRDVILLCNQTSLIPKLKQKQKLCRELRCQTLQFKRNMACSEVKETIIKGFRPFSGINQFRFLEIKGQKLVVSITQDIDGETVINRRGALYLWV